MMIGKLRIKLNIIASIGAEQDYLLALLFNLLLQTYKLIQSAKQYLSELFWQPWNVSSW